MQEARKFPSITAGNGGIELPACPHPKKTKSIIIITANIIDNIIATINPVDMSSFR
jgi:hypothetical protein